MGKHASLVIKITNDSSVEDIEAQAFEQLSSAGMDTALAAKAASEIATDMMKRREMIIRDGGTLEVDTDLSDDEEDPIIPVIGALNRTTEALVSVMETAVSLTKNQRRFAIALIASLGLVLFATIMLNLIVLDVIFHR